MNVGTLTTREEVETAIKNLQQRIDENADDLVYQQELRRRKAKAEQLMEEGQFPRALHIAAEMGA